MADTPFRIEKVHISRLWVHTYDEATDFGYQRPLSQSSEKLIRELMSQWDAALVGTIICSTPDFHYQRPGSLLQQMDVTRRDGFGDDVVVVVDGQHRIEIYRRLGVEWIEVQISDMSYGQQAKVFRHMNRDRKDATLWEKHIADIQYDEPVALAIRQEMAKYGWKPWKSSGPDTVAAISGLEKLSEMGLLTEGVRVYIDAFGETTSALGNDLVDGMVKFLTRYHKHIHSYPSPGWQERLSNKLQARYGDADRMKRASADHARYTPNSNRGNSTRVLLREAWDHKTSHTSKWRLRKLDGEEEYA